MPSTPIHALDAVIVDLDGTMIDTVPALNSRWPVRWRAWITRRYNRAFIGGTGRKGSEHLRRCMGMVFSNTLSPSRLHPVHGRTTAKQRWDTAPEALEPAFGCRAKSVARGRPSRKASFLASSTG